MKYINLNAVFISDNSRYYHILGNVPKEIRDSEGIRVIACLEEIPRHGCLTYGVGTIYKLTCIEKIK